MTLNSLLLVQFKNFKKDWFFHLLILLFSVLAIPSFTYSSAFASVYGALFVIPTILYAYLYLPYYLWKLKVARFPFSWRFNFSLVLVLATFVIAQTTLTLISSFLTLLPYWKSAEQNLVAIYQARSLRLWIEWYFYVGYGVLMSAALQLMLNRLIVKKNWIIIINLILLILAFPLSGFTITFLDLTKHKGLFVLAHFNPFFYLNANAWTTFLIADNRSVSGVFNFTQNLEFEKLKIFSSVQILMNYTAPFLIISVANTLHNSLAHKSALHLEKFLVVENKKQLLKRLYLFVALTFLALSALIVAIYSLIVVNHNWENNSWQYTVGSILLIFGTISLSFSGAFIWGTVLDFFLLKKEASKAKKVFI